MIYVRLCFGVIRVWWIITTGILFKSMNPLSSMLLPGGRLIWNLFLDEESSTKCLCIVVICLFLCLLKWKFCQFEVSSSWITELRILICFVSSYVGRDLIYEFLCERISYLSSFMYWSVIFLWYGWSIILCFLVCNIIF